MKTIIPPSTISGIAALLVFANAPCAFAKPQKKPGGSSQENAAPLVKAAMKNMETGVWSVKGSVQIKRTIKLQGLLSGEDFDLTTEPGVRPNTPMREIIIKDRVWICSDGETWHAGQPNDRLIYNWAHVPIMAGGMVEMQFQKVGTEQRDGQTWLHVRLKVPEKNVNPKELPQYWLVLDSQGQAQYIGHTEMPMFSQARKEVMYCNFDYAPAKEKIAPPPLGAPIDDKAYGFNDIEQHKFDWKGKVVRLEVTPRILESKEIAEDTYRGFFKDTATPNHYGVVEFPHDALVKLGFLKKIVDGAHASEDLEKMGALGRSEGEPVSFYVQVIPIGEKPAARTVAVGARVVRDPDGSVSYTWSSDEKQTAKSPPAPGASDASDNDLVNRGIEKAKNGDLDGAIADFDRAAELNPKDDAPYYNRAQARQLKNDKAGAIADYTKAIELGSTNPAAYNNRGNARAENNDRDGAIADYTRAIELKPDYARAYYNRATTFIRQKKWSAALLDLNSMIRLKPSFFQASFDRAGVNERLGNYPASLNDLDTLVRLAPKVGSRVDLSEALNSRAWLRATCPVASMRNGQLAIADAKKACELTKWKWAWQIDTLAAAYAAENWGEVDRLVSDDVVRRHTACGTPQQVRDRLDEYRAIGLDEIVLGGMDDVASIEITLKAING